MDNPRNLASSNLSIQSFSPSPPPVHQLLNISFWGTLQYGFPLVNFFFPSSISHLCLNHKGFSPNISRFIQFITSHCILHPDELQIANIHHLLHLLPYKWSSIPLTDHFWVPTSSDWLAVGFPKNESTTTNTQYLLFLPRILTSRHLHTDFPLLSLYTSHQKLT